MGPENQVCYNGGAQGSKCKQRRFSPHLATAIGALPLRRLRRGENLKKGSRGYASIQKHFVSSPPPTLRISATAVLFQKHVHSEKTSYGLIFSSERDPNMVCWRQVRSDQCSSAQGLPVAITNAGINNQLVDE